MEKEKVVVFMKGVPEAPQCGFSNAVCTFCLLSFYHECVLLSLFSSFHEGLPNNENA